MNRSFVMSGVMLGMFLAAMESSMVSTAMPTVVSQLGGLHIYSLVFSVYLLTSTVTGPLWGRWSDVKGRKRFYMIGMTVFLIGSALSGACQTMGQLVATRTLQGIGAGALMSLGLTIVGDLYSLEERARMQGWLSGTWGTASLIGPFLGGALSDHWSWRWIFYINIPFGLAAMAVIGWALKEVPRTQARSVDLKGMACYALGFSVFLLSWMRFDVSHDLSWPLRVGLTAMAAGCIWQGVRWERKAEEPFLPPELFRIPLYRATLVSGMLSGMAMFGAISFIPLFVQGVMGSTATRAGATLIPFMMGWVCCSVVSARWMLRIGYRRVILAGVTLLLAGFMVMTTFHAGTSRAMVSWTMLELGIAMGCLMAPMLIAVQHVVPKARLGIATSSVQFSRMIGGALGVALMGAMVTSTLSSYVDHHPLPPDIGASEDIERLVKSPNALVDPHQRERLPPALFTYLQLGLAEGLHGAFLAGCVVAALAFVSAWWTPSILSPAPTHESPIA